MENKTLSALDIYMNRVFKIVLSVIPGTALCAGLTFTSIKLFGFYPDVSWPLLIIFDVTCLLYFIAGLSLISRSITPEGELKRDHLHRGKIIIALIEIVQWNFITYMIPSRDFWAYAAFFVALTTLFLDSKYVLLITAEISVSMIISWFLRGDVLLPVKDSLFIPEMILRVVFLCLVFTFFWLLTYLVETKLVRELEHMADFDSLTMLHSRRSMEKSLNSALDRVKAGGGKFSLLMCDIDDFKRVNDTYGHECGDDVLKAVAAAISKNISASDLAFRYGGEEMLILVNSNEAESLEVAEKIRKEVESTVVYDDGTPVSVTITIGASTYDGSHSIQDLLSEADSNLYFGKRHGKNQVVK